EPSARARRTVSVAVRRARAGVVRAVQRPGLAARERTELRTRTAADLRSRQCALGHQLWRRLPGYVEFTSGAERCLRADAAGTRGDSRIVCAGRGADVADGRE